MKRFTVYVFDEKFRQDKKSGNIAFVLRNEGNTDRVITTTMLFMSRTIISYDDEDEHYTVQKCRTGNSTGRFHESLPVIANCSEIYFVNHRFGTPDKFDAYLNLPFGASQVYRKFCKISLEGLEEPEIFLTALME